VDSSTEDKVQWCVLLNMIMNLAVLHKSENALSSGKQFSSEGELLLDFMRGG